MDLDQEGEPMKFLSYMRTLNTPLFSGVANPLDANDWIKRLEKNFDFCKCPTELKMDIAVRFLAGDAIHWWQKVERVSYMKKTWTEFKKGFKMRYLPPEARDSIEQHLIKLIQGSMSVREYESEFWRLLYFLLDDNDYNNNEKADIRRFIRGLRPDIRIHLISADFNRLTDVIRKAILIEENIQEEKMRKAATATFTFGSKAPCTDHASTSRKNKLGKKKNCLARGGHRVGPCTICPSAEVCYNFGNQDHISRNCKNVEDPVMPPTKRQALFAPASSSGNKDPVTGKQV
ncbi:uncharacterized protein LOC111829473 [Capsella rubella]|uniref:uncharacterized protein LOC111829473 n=1 Tax=Capsella rubella TaxID=81985 RepID=UPI000CD4ED0D|nr:uncharacterized protein LOC111829473 [Capsella rubella]